MQVEEIFIWEERRARLRQFRYPRTITDGPLVA